MKNIFLRKQVDKSVFLLSRIKFALFL